MKSRWSLALFRRAEILCLVSLAFLALSCSSGTGPNQTKYRVSFDLNYPEASGAPADQTLGLGAKVQEPAQPQRLGYAFAGWYRDSICSAVWKFDSDQVTASIRLYAKWSLSFHQVAFDLNYPGCPAGPASQNIAPGAAVAEPATPDRSGYAFRGWFMDAACAAAWRFAEDCVSSPLTLYAKWKLLYTVSFDLNSSAQVDPPPSQSVAEGEPAAEPSAPLDGDSIVAAWYLDSACTQPWDFAAGMVSSNLTLYARWATACTVEFSVDIDSADWLSDFDDRIVAQGNKTGRPETANVDFLRTDGYYLISGWFKESACVSEWNFEEDEVRESLTLYAGWSLKTVTVDFDLNYGDSPMPPASQTVKFNFGCAADPSTLETIARTGYALLGWYRDADCRALQRWDFAKLCVDDMTLYARWGRAATIALDLGSGGLELPAEIVVRKAEPLAVSATAGYASYQWYVDDSAQCLAGQGGATAILDSGDLETGYHTLTVFAFDAQGHGRSAQGRIKVTD